MAIKIVCVCVCACACVCVWLIHLLLCWTSFQSTAWLVNPFLTICAQDLVIVPLHTQHSYEYDISECVSWRVRVSVLGGRYDPSPVKQSSEWLSEWALKLVLLQSVCLSVCLCVCVRHDLLGGGNIFLGWLEAGCDWGNLSVNSCWFFSWLLRACSRGLPVGRTKSSYTHRSGL